MLAICLIAALSGAPLRQAEAANDFVRQHAGTAEESVIEQVDGGVGDDSGETILKHGYGIQPLDAIILMANDCLSTLLPIALFPSPIARRYRPELGARPSMRSLRIHALIQRLLF
jgi:hypothetical protein